MLVVLRFFVGCSAIALSSGTQVLGLSDAIALVQHSKDPETAVPGLPVWGSPAAAPAMAPIAAAPSEVPEVPAMTPTAAAPSAIPGLPAWGAPVPVPAWGAPAQAAPAWGMPAAASGDFDFNTAVAKAMQDAGQRLAEDAFTRAKSVAENIEGNVTQRIKEVVDKVDERRQMLGKTIKHAFRERVKERKSVGEKRFRDRRAKDTADDIARRAALKSKVEEKIKKRAESPEAKARKAYKDQEDAARKFQEEQARIKHEADEVIIKQRKAEKEAWKKAHGIVD